MMRNILYGAILMLLPAASLTVRGQSVLQAGFDPSEYLAMLRIDFTGQDSLSSLPASDSGFRVNPPEGYIRQYRSAEAGFKNRWSMWYRRDRKVAVISIRGTIADAASWLANFYAALVPANGVLQLSDSNVFAYQLAADEKAMVHVGWLVSLGFLAPSMVQQIRKAYEKGIHDFIISGHSQGGAIAFLTSSYLHYLVEKEQLPSDIVFKTYCSAGPKPGNLYYAYDFDFITRNGWGFNVVNAADWVPESPFSIQTVADFNKTNPFMHVDLALKKQPFLVRWYLKGKYNRLRRSTRKAQRNFRNVLGNVMYRQAKKTLPQLKAPVYSNGYNYQRAGVPIVLQPDSIYYQKFPDIPGRVFQHHLFEPYYWMVKRYYGR
ncbi:lipase family protein [Flavitalea sp. BT771]|nr:lipase family protein [Flavitalea sp. BT771]